VVKIIERRKTPSFCLLKDIRDPADFWRVEISDRLQGVPLEWAAEWMDVPLLRRSDRSAGYHTPLSLECSSAATQLKRLGRNFGLKDDLEFKAF
jgi:Protein of unknown function (DUF3435)